MKKYRLHCEILSPIHIGTGYEIDPLNYIVDKGRLYRLSFDIFVASLDEAQRENFEGLIDKGDLIEIRRYVADNIDKDRDAVTSFDVSPGIAALYRTKMSDIQNQLLIKPFIRTESETVAFIPGSSLKGSIRTAVISELAKKNNLPKPGNFREEREFESKVLRYKDAKNDPFRGIKIRDASLSGNSTIVREVRNVSRKEGVLQSNSIQQICEVTHSAMTGSPVGFETEISFDESLFSTGFLSRRLTAEEIIKSCTAFYKEKMEKEHNKFYKNSEVENYSAQLLDTPLDEKSFLLRLGRFSGVESVTLDKYRNPKPPGNKTVWGTSRNLAEGIYPMGWGKITVSE
ncbi:MAG TPA: type III-A CRISPR-associated RAMP protein Csm5 [Nitrospirae bacterium]|nr:type III-A CRISPR-associated RAMP protein Csm5 [Nitrospirota bacterium]